jgi:starch-binding outer membrane protein, SusD/RagB family
MKKLIIFLVIIFGLLTGCENVLEKSPLDQISSESFWKSESDFQLACNNLYTYLSLDITLDNWSTDYFERGTNSISSGNHVVSNSDGTWNNSYTAIRRANEIIESAESSEIESSISDRYKAEASFFRAYLYFRLVQRFGDVPLILETLDFTSEELTSARTPRNEVVDQIIADLQYASANLPKKSELAGSEKGRITRGAALGLLSRIALFEGTHEKYHGHGNPSSRLQVAVQAATDFINDNQYPLISDFTQLYSEDNENHAEIVIAKHYKESITGTSPLGRGLVIDAQIIPTKYLADAFLCIDGLPIQYSSHFKGYTSLESEFTDRDPRMEYTIWKPGTDFGGSPLVPDLRWSSTGYWPKKPGDPKALSTTFIYTDQILLRSAEVLLNYAEAVYELNGSISDSELDLSINKLRNRVGMPALTNSFVEGNNPASVTLNMLDEIRRERRIELAGEGFRYYDLIRWKQAETELPRTIIGAKFQQSAYPDVEVGEDIAVDNNGFIVAQTEATRQFTVPKHYLFPIPLGERALNSNLTQNPGWE